MNNPQAALIAAAIFMAPETSVQIVADDVEATAEIFLRWLDERD